MRRHDADVHVLVVQVRGRPACRRSCPAGTGPDEVTEPVRVLVADDGVVQDEEAAAGFDELPKMRLPFP
jgi:hypothetical protein